MKVVEGVDGEGEGEGGGLLQTDQLQAVHRRWLGLHQQQAPDSGASV